MELQNTNIYSSFLKGGGEMGELIRNFDWANHPLGTPDKWPISLLAVVGIMLNSRFPMYIMWGKEYYSLYNDAYRPSLGKEGKHPNILGQPVLEAFPEARAFLKESLQRVIETGEATWREDDEIPIYRDGQMETGFWTFSHSPVLDDNGNIGGVLVTCTETTHKVVTMKKLEESEMRFKTIIKEAPLAICVLKGRDFRVEMVNGSFSALVDRTEKELLDNPILTVMPEVAGLILPVLTNTLETQTPFHATEFMVPIERHGDISKGYFNFIFHPMRLVGDEEATLIGVGMEVTASVEAKKKLQVSEQQFRLLATAIPHFVWTGDASGQLNYFNDAVFEYSGMSMAEIMEKGWLEIVHPDDREENVRRWLNAIETGENFHFEHRFRKHDGTYRWQLSRAIPHKNEAGEIQMWVGTSTDIQEQILFTQELERLVKMRTELLQEANQKLEKSIEELQKSNAQLQSFAYISSHDLQEPLRKIRTFAGRIMEKESDKLSEKGREYFIRMQDAATRMQKLIEDLLAYSRTSSSDQVYKRMEMSAVLEEVRMEFEDSLSEKNATVSVTGIPFQAEMVGFQFVQLFHNLFSNAIKFSKPDIPLHITIQTAVVSGAELPDPKLNPDIEYGHVSFSDNGIGFDSVYQDRIFEVFQRLHGKNEYSGTGIGLAIVKKIVENHHGAISATGVPGLGARFDVYIPLEQ